MKNLVVVISLVMFFATAGGVKANEYEVPSDRKFSEILPAKADISKQFLGAFNCNKSPITRV